ncbi:MAG TPA: response regulator [Thermoanaerobaculia bacterium]|nr:response regulator [Thermoanaerobaculia bacterium]
MAELTGKRILIIDDDPAIRRLISPLLINEGALVIEADNTIAALEMLDHHTFDATVLDLMMPDSSGFEVLQYLEKNSPRDKCVIVISAASESTLNSIESPVVHQIVRKPLDLDRLEEALIECVRRPTADPSST